jgi:NADH-quinone oxidoreductase subunit C
MMSEQTGQVLAALKSRFGDVDFQPSPLMVRAEDSTAPEQTCVRVPAEKLLEVMRFLHEDERCSFEQLCDLTCVDYLNFPDARDRYGVVYALLSLSRNDRLWVKCFVNDPTPEVPSVTEIWHGAEWMEREAWDMFGVRFSGHADLRRILTWEAFEAHPLRKDYPLRGRGERERFDVLTRDSR